MYIPCKYARNQIITSSINLSITLAAEYTNIYTLFWAFQGIEMRYRMMRKSVCICVNYSCDTYRQLRLSSILREENAHF